MEEKEKDRFKGLPWYIDVAVLFVCVFIALYAVLAFRNGTITTPGLIVSIVAIGSMCWIRGVVNGNDRAFDYEEKIEELNNIIDCVERENAELRDVVRNLSKPKKKQKKDDRPGQGTD